MLDCCCSSRQAQKREHLEADGMVGDGWMVGGGYTCHLSVAHSPTQAQGATSRHGAQHSTGRERKEESVRFIVTPKERYSAYLAL
jgi:hypothetical protein